MASKTCVITGASRGIGLATALRFARAGCNIVAAARDGRSLEQAAEQIRTAGAACETVAVDVSQPGGGARLIDAAVNRFKRVDVLVNNAGFAVLKPIDQTQLEDFDQTVAVNCRAVFQTTQAAWPQMKAHGGVIINVSSVSSVDPFPGFSVYGACKAWVNIFTQAVAAEGKEFGLRVYAVAPGAVETQMLQQLLPDLPEKYRLDPDAVAGVIESLCEDRAAPVTGQTIFVRK